MERCIRCNRPALRGVTSGDGPVCEQHMFEYLGLPPGTFSRGEAEQERACKICKLVVPRYEGAVYLQDNGFFHDKCLKRGLERLNKCPKCDGILKRDYSKPSQGTSCYCWSGEGGPIERLITQGKLDAIEVFRAGGRHNLCRMCLRFNMATQTGLPFYSRPPERADDTCVQCFQPVCEDHIARAPKDNVMKIPTTDVFCSGAWIDGCYQELEKMIACGYEDCPTTRPSYRDEDFNALDDTKKCEDCDTFYCNYEYGHNECPECKGYKCEDCDERMPKDYLHAYQEDSYSFKDICESCLEKQQEEEDEEEAQSDWLREYPDSLVKRFRYYGVELELDDVDEERLEELFFEAKQACDLYVEHHSEGPYLNIDHVAECTDPVAVISLRGAIANDHHVGPNAPLTRKVHRAVQRMQAETPDDSWQAGRQARYRDDRKRKRPMSRKRRAELREHFRQSMKRSWYRRGDPKRRALEKAPKTVKGMRPFLGMLDKERRGRFSEALRKERKRKRRPNPFWLW